MEQLWRLGLVIVLVVALLPADFAFVGYGTVLANQSYSLIKASMPFIPLGVLLMLVWRKAEIQVVTLALYVVFMPMLWISPAWGWLETRNMLFAWPGLAMGMALASASQHAFFPVARPHRQQENRV